MTNVYGVTGYFRSLLVIRLLVIDIWLRSFLLNLILIRRRIVIYEGWKGITVEKKKKRKDEREDIFSISTLFHLGFSHGYSVTRNVSLDYLRIVVSPKSGVEIYLSFPMVNKFIFSVVMSSVVFILLASACRLANSWHNQHAKSRDLANRSAT